MVERIRELCKQNGITVQKLEKAVGLGNGTIRRWDNAVPSADKLAAVASFFGVTVDYLLTGQTQDDSDQELDEYLEELKNRSEMRMLFKLAKGATKEDVEQAVRIIEAIRNKP